MVDVKHCNLREVITIEGLSPHKDFISGEPVARGAFFLAAGRITALACGFILQIAMAHMLGVEKYGLFGLIISLLTWLEIVFWGLNNVVSRETARSPRKVSSLEKVYALLQLPISIFLFLLGTGIAYLIAFKSGRDGVVPYFMLAFLDIPLLGLYSLYLGLLNGMRAYMYQALSFSSYYLSRLFFCILLVGLGLSLYGAIIGNILCSLTGLSLGFFLLHQLSYPKNRTSGENMASMARLALPFIAVSITFNLTLNAHLWLVGVIGTGKELGMYNAAFSLSRISFVLLGGLIAALFPATAASLHVSDAQRSRRLGELGLRFLLIALAPIVIYGTVASEPLILIFGNAYRGGGTYLSALLASFGLASLISLFNYIQMAGGQFRSVLAWNSLSIVLEFLLSFILLPHLGIHGVSLSLLISLTAIVLPLYYHTRAILGSFLTARRLGRILFAAALSSVPLIFARSPFSLFPILLASLTLYLALLIMGGETSLEEIQYWLKLMLGLK